MTAQPGPAIRVAGLEKSYPKLHVLRGVDFFNLWSAGLLGLGFSAATGMSRGRALVFGFVLYVLFAGVVFVGVPGMMAAKAGGAS